MKERLSKLLTVKSLVTLALTAVFCVLAITGELTGRDFLTIFTVVVAFYFGTQSRKAGEETAFISCGTWSLFGIENKTPILNDEAKNAEFTNEAGFDNTTRFLKNIMGMWLFQNIRK